MKGAFGRSFAFLTRFLESLLLPGVARWLQEDGREIATQHLRVKLNNQFPREAYHLNSLNHPMVFNNQQSVQPKI